MARPKKKPVCQPIPPVVFEAEARAAGHKLWRFTYYDADKLCSVVLADEVVTGAMDGISKEWNLNGEDVVLGVKRI